MSFISQGSLKKPFLVLLTIGLVVRFILMPLLTFNADIAYWIHAISLEQNNLGLYDVDGYYYTPIWGYLMNLSAFIGQFIGITDYGIIVPELAEFVNTEFILNEIVTTFGFNVLMKVALVLCDLTVALLIYGLVMRLCNDEKKSLVASALWFLSPLVITQSSVHAMFDCLSAMTILLSVIFLMDRKYFLTGVMFSLAVLTKFFPLFFFFILIAALFKKEGFGKEGIDSFRNAFLGAFLTLILVELPYIVNGEFFRSMDFLIGRLGIDYAILAPFSPYVDYAFLIGVFIFVMVLISLMRKYGGGLYEKCCSMDREIRDKKVIKKLLKVAVILSLMLIVYSVFNYPKNAIDLMEILTFIGMKLVSFIMVYALLIEFFIAYKYLFSEDHADKALFLNLMLTSLVIFLWPPSPPYIIVSLPFIIVYSAVYENKLIGPCILMMCLMTLMDLPSYLTSLQSIAYYVPGVSFDIILAPLNFLTSTIFGIEYIVFAVAILGIPAYLSILNIIRVWYMSTREADV